MITSPRTAVFSAALARKGWLGAHRFLIARRVTQLGVLGLFLAGPLAGLWIVKGTLASSVVLGVLPLSDPFIALQALAAGHLPEATLLAGAAIVLAFYLVIGGRAYCGWVCPVNLVSDAAAWLRRRAGIEAGAPPSRATRYALLAAVFAVCAATGTLVWELVNPVTLLHRALVFGAFTGAAAALGVFVFDLVVAARGWCGHVCPMGAFYALLGRAALLRVSARHASRCNDCRDCLRACPEPQVIQPALKGGGSPVILGGACTNCGRCIDVCAPDVFRFTNRFDTRRE